MELIEEKILEFYKSKRTTLLEELDVVNNLIAGIEWLVAAKRLGDKEKWQADLDLEFFKEKELDDKPVFLSHTFHGSFRMPSLYKKTMTYNEKVMFSLQKLVSATVYEMVDLLKAYEKPEDQDKLFNGLTMAASTLFRNKEIEATKDGKRNKYRLLTEQEKKRKDKRDELANDPGEM